MSCNMLDEVQTSMLEMEGRAGLQLAGTVLEEDEMESLSSLFWKVLTSLVSAVGRRWQAQYWYP